MMNTKADLEWSRKRSSGKLSVEWNAREGIREDFSILDCSFRGHGSTNYWISSSYWTVARGLPEYGSTLGSQAGLEAVEDT